MKNKLFYTSVLLLIFSQVSLAEVKSFVYCSEASPSGFNPQMATDGPTFSASSAVIYNQLVEFKNGSTEIEPSLAESWKVSADGKTFTFKLHKDVQFHSNKYFTPTRNFNADDVIFSFERMLDPKHPYSKVSGGVYEYFQSMDMQKIIKEIKKVDDYTVQIILSQVEAPFLADIAMDFASIFSSEYADKMLKAKTPERVDTDPIGTGSFQFKSYQKDTAIKYTAFEKHFRGKPQIEQLIYSITPDAGVRFQKLKVKECQLMAEPAPQDLHLIKANPDLKLIEREGLNIGYLAFNVEKKPFDNVKVREAIGYALNRKSYIDAIYIGRGVVAKNPIPPTMWSYNNDIQDYEYNPEKAKKLLAEAGFKDGFKTELWTLPVSRPYNPGGKKMGEMMQADLAKVGITVTLKTYDWPTYLEKSRKGEHQMMQFGWSGDNGDPDNFLNVLLGCASVQSGGNVSRWCDKEFDSLVQKARQTIDIKKRTELYKKAQVVFRKNMPWIPIAHSQVFKAMTKSLQGYSIQPFGTENFDTAHF